MSMNYTKEAKDEAKRRNLKLATIGVAGLAFQGPVTAEEEKKLVRMFIEFQDHREKHPLPALPPEETKPAVTNSPAVNAA